jgi:phage gp29-like protein
VKWWVKFAEVLLGYRIGKYDGNDDTQKDLLIAAIRGLAEDAAAVISKDSAIEFVEMAGKATSHQVYSEFKDWCNNEMSELVLGHTGSTQSTPGKLGGEDNAKEVKQELVEADAEAADEAITDDIIVPFVLLNFGEQEEYPYYKTDVSPNLDLSKEADVGIKIQQMGGKFKAKTIKERFGWPLANDDEEILTPTPPANSFQSPGTNTTVAADGKKKLLNSR